MYDIVFISYNEPTADQNWKALQARFPRAKRIHGVKGIHQAHIAAAQSVLTRLFWVVDADAVILDTFNFDYKVPNLELESVHVWRSRNPINDLEYGYGGVKLFPRRLTISMDTSNVDMSTSIGSKFNAMPAVSNITAFNTDPFSTWKSAFRECCKLSSKAIEGQIDAETTERLDIWCTVGSDRLYGSYAIAGAIAGRKYGQENASNKEALFRINDFSWLEDQFNSQQDS